MFMLWWKYVYWPSCSFLVFLSPILQTNFMACVKISQHNKFCKTLTLTEPLKKQIFSHMYYILLVGG